MLSLNKSSVPTSAPDKMDDIRKMGSLKKLKTMKKKYFILRVESENGPSRLEYYDNEKKWRAGNPPKRAINLKTCFNINRKLDTKQKYVIALYTKDDSFAISLESEAELEEWLIALLQLQHGEEYFGTDEKPRPTFEHVWQVNVKSRGLGSSKNILGPYRLCLTERSLSLIQMSSSEPAIFEFPLVSIRRCGNSDSFFFMEVGRNAITGAGELWMLTEDMLIAQNMHETILNAMKSSHKEDVAPRTRPRSSSTNEASRPISVHCRRQQTNPVSAHVVSRDRADSMPNRPRTISDGQRDGGTKTCRLSHNFERSSTVCDPILRKPSPSSGNSFLGSGETSYSVEEYSSSPSELLSQKATKESESESAYTPMAPGEAESKTNQDADNDYMAMNSSPAVDVPFSTPRSDALMSCSIQSHDVSFATPPTWLSLSGSAGGPGKLSSSPPVASSVGSDYLEMGSPAVTSAVGTPEGYMPMSPVGSYMYSQFTNLSRQAATSSSSSSVVQSTPEKGCKHDEGNNSENVNGYVPMAPVKENLSLLKAHSPPEDEGYLDMNPVARSLSRNTNDGEQKVDSSSRRSSVTSGTPSTDLCFTEYQLEKVRAYFTPTDEDEPIVRAYSVGSREDCERKSKLEVSTDSSRIRAYSVGSKVGVKFGNKLSGANVSSAAVPKVTDDKGKKCSSAPLLGTSPFSNSWSGPSFLNRIHSASRSSNPNEDLMEMDFPESSNRSSGNVTQGFWMDGNRKSGAVSSGSSTDSLRRTPTGSRPRSNSRSSHSRPSKLETLQSIGEKSGSKSPPSEGISSSKPIRSDSYAEMAEFSKFSPKSPPKSNYSDDRLHCGVTSSISALTAALGDTSKVSTPSPDLSSKLASQESQDYVNMTCEESTKSADKKTEERKRSLPVSIHGARPIEMKDQDSSFGSGEYVSIDMSRGYSSSPTRFSIMRGATATPVTISSKTSSSPNYSSTRFSSNGSSYSWQRFSSGSSASPTIVPKFSQKKTEVKQSPEYVNLQYGKHLHGRQVVDPFGVIGSVPDVTAGVLRTSFAPTKGTVSTLVSYCTTTTTTTTATATATTTTPTATATVTTTTTPTATATVTTTTTTTATTTITAATTTTTTTTITTTTTTTTTATAATVVTCTVSCSSSQTTSLLSQPKCNNSDYAIMTPTLPGIIKVPSQTVLSSPAAQCPSTIVSLTLTSHSPLNSVNISTGNQSSSTVTSTIPSLSNSGGVNIDSPAVTLPTSLEKSSERKLLIDPLEDEDTNVDNTSDVSCSSPIPPLIESQPSTASEVLYENISDQNSRPNSVIGEREINYASLDLVSSSTGTEESEASPQSPRGSIKSTSVSTDSSDGSVSLLSYAKIDFTKSDGLRCTTATAWENRK